jgi:hypothetical protein
MGEKGDGPVMTRVVVDGPYGGRGWRGLDQVEEVLCIAGGSGVSFLLGVAEEARALRHTQGEETNLRIVRLVWILRDYGEQASSGIAWDGRQAERSPCVL